MEHLYYIFYFNGSWIIAVVKRLQDPDMVDNYILTLSWTLKSSYTFELIANTCTETS